MILAAFFAVLAAVTFWALFYALAFVLLYGSLIVSYWVLWDPATRRQICPHGLFKAIFSDH